MKKSESIKELAEALCNLQEEVTDVPKNTKAKSISKNGKEYSRDYADLAGVLEIGRPLLKKHGLSITQHPGQFVNGNVSLTTLVTHTSGEWIESQFEAPYIKQEGMNEPQSVGSIITYMRRYVLKGIFSMADADSDAQGSSSGHNQTKPQQKASYSVNTVRPSLVPLINPQQVKELGIMIGGDIQLSNYIRSTYKIRELEDVNQDQYVKIRDDIRVMKATTDESKFLNNKVA